MQLSVRTEDDVWDEEQGGCNVVLIASEAEVLVHAFDLSVADISTINVGKQIEHSHHANEPEVDLHTEADKQSAVGNFLTSNDRIKEYLPNDPLPFFPLKPLRQLDILRRQSSVLVSGCDAFVVLVLQFVLHGCLLAWKKMLAEYKAQQSSMEEFQACPLESLSFLKRGLVRNIRRKTPGQCLFG